MSQQIRRLVQLKRGLRPAVLWYFAPRFLHRSVKRGSLCKQSPLQHPWVYAQFESYILHSRPPTNQLLLQDAPLLIFQEPIRELLCRFGFYFRRRRFTEIRIVCEEKLNHFPDRSHSVARRYCEILMD